ncbi:nitrilase-related carbon-nitrogen hydrolase [Candidatus Dormiibacter inghamiae]|uniref:nitrilase-related carbon-nitrogen hydrolase n=1 Tax=Candidatus Dormiibacter inghamiae TaxID=3127013 RepID=UPI003312FCB9
MLLFPELSLVGHGSSIDTLDLALALDDPRIAEIAAASAEMCTVFGFIEEGPAAQFYNATAAVRRSRVEFVHRKINLATYGRLEEGKYYASGRKVDTFEVMPGWRTGVLICADLWNPPLVHLAAMRGATLLLSPISSAIEAVGAEFDNPGGWRINVQFYAMIYGMPIAIANRVGHEGDLTFWGGSRILDPFGNTLAEAQPASEQLIVAELDYNALRKARYLLPTVRDSNVSLIVRELARLNRTAGILDM